MIGAAAEKILCEGCSLLAPTDKCAMCPGPMEFLAHLGEMVEAALSQPPSTGHSTGSGGASGRSLPEGEGDEEWHARVKSVEGVREMMREYAA